jgi:hypothetical protein
MCNDDKPLTSIDSKEQFLKFLKHHYVDGKWIERECDAEGRYIIVSDGALVAPQGQGRALGTTLRQKRALCYSTSLLLISPSVCINGHRASGNVSNARSVQHNILIDKQYVMFPKTSS